MRVSGILWESLGCFWDVLGFYELLMGVSSNDGTFDPSLTKLLKSAVQPSFW